MSLLQPLADGAGSVSVGGPVIENGRDQVTVYASLGITRDKRPTLARELAAFAQHLVARRAIRTCPIASADSGAAQGAEPVRMRPTGPEMTTGQSERCRPA